MRHQLPAWSPISLGALAAGLAPPRDAAARLAGRILAEYGARRVVLTGSGTHALALALHAAAPEGLRPRVALPGWACYDLMTAADMVDAEVLLYDLIPETLGPDPDSLGRALHAEPHAVVAAHWFGLPLDLDPLTRQSEAAGALLIDDAAQGAGASMRGRPVGAGGAYGVLSFGRGKGRTGGGGGAVMAFTDAAAEALARSEVRLEASGNGAGSLLALSAQWALGRPWLYGIPSHWPGVRLGETIYHRAGTPTRISARSAAIVNEVWNLSSTEARTRRAHADRWRAELTGVDDIYTYRMETDRVAGWLRYPVLTSPRVKRVFQQEAARRHGVMPGYPGVLGDLPVPSHRMLVAKFELQGARTLADRLFTLPTHHHLRGLDFETIRRCVQPER